MKRDPKPLQEESPADQSPVWAELLSSYTEKKANKRHPTFWDGGRIIGVSWWGSEFCWSAAGAGFDIKYLKEKYQGVPHVVGSHGMLFYLWMWTHAIRVYQPSETQIEHWTYQVTVIMQLGWINYLNSLNGIFRQGNLHHCGSCLSYIWESTHAPSEARRKILTVS